MCFGKYRKIRQNTLTTKVTIDRVRAFTWQTLSRPLVRGHGHNAFSLEETTTHTIGQKVLDMSVTKDESATLQTEALGTRMTFSRQQCPRSLCRLSYGMEARWPVLITWALRCPCGWCVELSMCKKNNLRAQNNQVIWWLWFAENWLSDQTWKARKWRCYSTLSACVSIILCQVILHICSWKS